MEQRSNVGARALLVRLELGRFAFLVPLETPRTDDSHAMRCTGRCPSMGRHAPLAVMLALPSCGDGQPGAQEPDPAGDVAEPEVCSGEHIACAAPDATALETGPEITPELSDGGAAEVVWKMALGELDCGGIRCVAVGVGLAVDGDGGVWVRSNLHAAGTSLYRDGPALGIGLHRFDANGNETFAGVTDVHARLAGVPPATVGMVVDELGRLSWIAPMRGRPGVELRTHDAGGGLVSTRALVDEALSGKGVIGRDGSVTLAYRYAVDLSAVDPLSAGWSTDVARFGPTGKLAWNQPASTVLSLGARDLPHPG